jgi:hypothetical protein
MAAVVVSLGELLRDRKACPAGIGMRVAAR